MGDAACRASCTSRTVVSCAADATTSTTPAGGDSRSGRMPTAVGFLAAIISLIKPREPEVAYAALARFNLQDKLYARVDRLSGGERQRCGMARLLVSQADALLVDEPLSALDPTLALQTLAVVQLEAASRNATLVCSLHQVDLALSHFPRIVGLSDGRIVFDAPRNEVTETMLAALYRNTPSTQHPESIDPEDTCWSGPSPC